MIDLRSLRVAAARASLEWWLCHPLAFGLTEATPAQRALCRVVDGGKLGDLATHPEVLEAFGGTVPTQETAQLVLLGGIRSAKSLFAAAASVRCSQRVDLSGIRQSDTPRFSICSFDLDKARVVLDDHLRGALERSPFLRAIFILDTADSILLRHPTGRPVEISVVAGKRAGSHLISRWSAGVAFDEAPRMVGGQDGVINLDDARTGVVGRLLPGSMMLLPGSPWAPFGPVYQLYQDHFGKPTREIVVAKCRGPIMNPGWFTPERCENIRRLNPDAHTVDVECNFITPEQALLSEAALAACSTLPDQDIPYDELQSYVAVMDPATRANAWTFVVATRVGDSMQTVCHREWRGSTKNPLRPKEVLKEIGELLRTYKLGWAYSDQWYIDANQDLAREEGFSIVQYNMDSHEKSRRYMQFRAEVIGGNIKLHNNSQIRADLQRVARKVTQNGIQIDLPRTADGRHCDYAPSVVVALTQSLQDRRSTKIKEDPETVRMREAHFKRIRSSNPWK